MSEKIIQNFLPENTYYKGKGTKLSANFNSKEFDCHGSGCCSQTTVNPVLVKYLQKIREHFNQPITITSGYRCPIHNRRIGGATGSRHSKGDAADIVVKNTEPAEVAKYAESIGVKGIGLYETDKDGYFVHIDARTTKSFWYGQAQAYRTTFGGQQIVEPYPYENFLKDVKQLLNTTNTADVFNKTITISKSENEAHPLVKPLQKYLYYLGFTVVGPADGIAGNNFEKAVKAYQKSIGAHEDGKILAKGFVWQSLLNFFAQAEPKFKVGDKVRLQPKARFTNGLLPLPATYKNTLYIRAIKDDSAIITAQQTGAVTGEVYLKDLILEDTTCQITVQANLLNVRKAPSLKAPIIKQLPKGSSHKIFEEENGWGHLVDSGWISLQYVIKEANFNEK